MSKMKSVILVDQDCILVSMLNAWLRQYNAYTGEDVKISDIKEYEMTNICNEKVLYEILGRRGFFYDMEPMPGAVAGMTELMNDGYDIVIVTQPPRKAEFAVRDKRRWILKYFPNFDLRSMIFCHRKDLIRGGLLFDDKPAHLISWKAANPKGLTATLDWRYNRGVEVDFRGSRKHGWKKFVKFVHKNMK